MNQAAQEILALLREQGPLAKSATIDQLRSSVSAFYARYASPQKMIQGEVLMNGVPGLWIYSPDIPPQRTVVFFHGGGYSVGSSRDHQELCGRLSVAAQAKVLSVDYRLAPENPFPAAVEDCLTACLWLLDRGLPAGDLFLAGLSAGGALVISTLVGLRDRGAALPAGAVCMSPAVDLRFPGQSVRTNQDKDWVTAQRLEAIRADYLAGQDPLNPLASPIHADLAGLPPLLVQAGENEIMLDDIKALVDKAKAQGVEAALEIWPEMFHCWQMFASALPEGQQALQSAGAFIQRSAPAKAA